MKIDHLTLENFGIYTHKSFQFDSAPLVLIYGPNESGKTTALHGLRQAMFGFRQRGGYITGRPMVASVAATLASGEALEFKRRKSRQDEVSGMLAGKKLEAEDVSRLLCNIDLASYEQLFGFCLDELREGENSLKSARLSDALAGGGLGGMQALQQLRTEIQESLSELYKSRGSTSTINVKLADIQRTKDALRGYEVLPQAVDELQRTLTETREQSQSIKLEIRQLAEKQLTTERLLSALPKYLELQAIKRQFDSLDVPEGIDSVFAAQWSDFAKQRQQLANRLDETRRQLDHDKQLLAQLAGSQEASAHEHEIEQLGHQAAEILPLRQRVGELRRQCTSTTAVCQNLLQQLELEQVTDALQNFVVSPRQRREITEASEQFSALGKQRIALQAKLEEAQDVVQALKSTREQSSFVPDNLAELQSLVRALDAAEGELHSRAQALRLATDDVELQRAHDGLQAWLKDGFTADVNWRIPSVEQIREFQQKFERLERERDEAERLHAQLTKDVESLREQLGQVDRRGTADLLKTDKVLRAARDTILNQWLDELEQPLLAASISPNDQRERLLELQRLATSADQTQTEIMGAAEAIAAYSQLEHQVAQAMLALEAVSGRTSELAQGLTTLQTGWEQLWCHLPVIVAPPAEMLDLQQLLMRWCEKIKGIDRLRREAHLMRSVVRTQRTSLLDAWPLSLREDTSCDALVGQLQTWESLQRDGLKEQQRWEIASANLEKLTLQIRELDGRQREWLDRYQSWLAQTPLQAGWPFEKAAQLLELLDRLRREHSTCEQLKVQCSEGEAALEKFGKRMSDLAERLGEAVDITHPESTAGRWLRELQEMRKQKTERIQLSAAIAHNTNVVEETTLHVRDLDEKLAKLCASVGSMDVSGVGSLVERVRRGEELRSRIAELAASLEPLAAGIPLESFYDQLQQTTDAALRVELAELTDDLHRLDDARKEADQKVGSLSQRLEQLAHNQAAQRQQQILQNQRGELAEFAEQWVVQRLSQQLLVKAIERFANDHEPQLLGHTRYYLEKLTGGRYTGVEHDSANPGKFAVRTASQQMFSPDQLSTGTREQLYLAIRMAFITHHVELQHEPLPVIMDDCFVNFDDLRVRYALEAIAGWDDRMQTILLSCHWRVVQMLAEIAPEVPAIHLERDLMTTVGELATQHATTLVP